MSCPLVPMLAVGGAIMGHPMGPAQGAKAMMQTVKACGEIDRCLFF